MVDNYLKDFWILGHHLAFTCPLLNLVRVKSFHSFFTAGLRAVKQNGFQS